jgi:hypothetical protein
MCLAYKNIVDTNEPWTVQASNSHSRDQCNQFSQSNLFYGEKLANFRGAKNKWAKHADDISF